MERPFNSEMQQAGSKFLFYRASLSENRFTLFRTHSSQDDAPAMHSRAREAAAGAAAIQRPAPRLKRYQALTFW
jgi:hypothetical protein